MGPPPAVSVHPLGVSISRSSGALQQSCASRRMDGGKAIAGSTTAPAPATALMQGQRRAPQSAKAEQRPQLDADGVSAEMGS